MSENASLPDLLLHIQHPRKLTDGRQIKCVPRRSIRVRIFKSRFITCLRVNHKWSTVMSSSVINAGICFPTMMQIPNLGNIQYSMLFGYLKHHERTGLFENRRHTLSKMSQIPHAWLKKVSRTRNNLGTMGPSVFGLCRVPGHSHS